MKSDCPLVPGHCEAPPNATAGNVSSLLQFDVPWASKRASPKAPTSPRAARASRAPPSSARGALLELLALTHAGEDPLKAVQAELENVINSQSSDDDEVKAMTPKAPKKTGPSPIEEHRLYSKEETVIAFAEKGTGLGPECPESYFAFQIDIDVEASTISAACNPCAAGCLHCAGPSEDQCRACPVPLKLFTHVDGRSVCVQGCPDCCPAFAVVELTICGFLCCVLFSRESDWAS